MQGKFISASTFFAKLEKIEFSLKFLSHKTLELRNFNPNQNCKKDFMPKRNDIQTILLIGSGPIVIGQACEFDYSGTQAAKTLKELGYKVVLINSNPATIMTDPEYY